MEPTGWQNRTFTLVGEIPYSYKDIAGALANLGEEGWELASISPRYSHPYANSAGFTSEEIWVFKRPKE